MEEEIYLGDYLRVLARRWKLIVGSIAVAVAVALVMGLWVIRPMYEAKAGLVLTSMRTKIAIEPRYQTLPGEVELRETVYQNRLRALTALAESPSVAREILRRIQESFGLQDINGVEDLLRRVKVKNNGDYIEIGVRWEDPETASKIANQWASYYEQYVNRIYGKMPESLVEDIKLQVQNAWQEYEKAERALVEFLKRNRIEKLKSELKSCKETLAHYEPILALHSGALHEAYQAYVQAQEEFTSFLKENRIEELKREIAARQNVLNSLKASLEQAIHSAIEEELRSRQEELKDYLGELRRVEELELQVRALARQLEHSPQNRTAALGDNLALVFLRARGLPSKAGLPVQLEVSMSEPQDINPSNALADLQKVLEAIGEYKEAVREKIRATSEELSDLPTELPEGERFASLKELLSRYEEQLRLLQQQLEIEEARYRELKLRRDSAWKAYEEHLLNVSKYQILSSPAAVAEVEKNFRKMLSLQEELEKEEAKLRELTLQRDSAWETYQIVLRKLRETEVASHVQEMEVRFVSPAVPPRDPVVPKPKLYTAVAAVLGLFVGVIAAFVIEGLKGNGKPQRQEEVL